MITRRHLLSTSILGLPAVLLPISAQADGACQAREIARMGVGTVFIIGGLALVNFTYGVSIIGVPAGVKMFMNGKTKFMFCSASKLQNKLRSDKTIRIEDWDRPVNADGPEIILP